MFIEHTTQEPANPYQDIEYFVASDLYQATFKSSKGTLHIGFYTSLEQAVAARKEFMEKRCTQRREAYMKRNNNQQHHTLESETTETYAQAITS